MPTTIIKDKFLIEDIKKYQIVLVPMSVNNSMNSGFAYEIGLNFPAIKEKVQTTPYGDRRKLGTVSVFKDDGITFCICFMHTGGQSKQLEYVKYDSLADCLDLININFKGETVVSPILGSTKYDGRGDKEKIIDTNFETRMLSEENRFSNGENISFFVKNIESVQGDERDIIIFCIGYAKNEKGRVAINFGWLNQDGGENRLNVAISRAKQKIYVVTSIEPEELIVDYTKNDGPKLFKQYLEYVKALSDGENELVKSQLLALLDRNESDQQQLTFDSVFEEEVCDRLIELGYNVETQYGVGGYRIDIVIKSKDGKDNILGIECDGRLYHSSKYARERDYHRQKYLESRGWKIYRIWSTNWWKNPDMEIKKIVKYIEKISSKVSE